MKSKKIIDAWNEITLNKERETQIFRIIQQKLNLKRKRRPLLIASIFVIIAMLTGGTYLITVKQYDFFGGTINIQMPWHKNAANYTMSEEQMEFEQQFFGNREDNLMRLIVQKEYSGASSSYWIPIHNYDEIQSYIGSDIFKIPQYLPDGYRFKEGSVQYYFEDIDLEAEPVYSEERFGKIYEKYEVPEINIENVWAIGLTYENDDGNCISYNAHLSSGSAEQTYIYADDSSNGEILELPNFKYGLLISDRNLKYSLRLYNDITPVTAIENAMFNKEVRRRTLAEETTISFNTEYNGILYYLNADCLEQDELMRLIQSMK